MEINWDLLQPYVKEVEKSGFKGTGVATVAHKPYRTNFAAVHKKPNLKFTQAKSTVNERRKTLRTNLLLSKRDPKMARIADNLNQLIHEDSSNEISAIECSSGASTPAAVAVVEDQNKQSKGKGARNGGDANTNANGVKSRIDFINGNKEKVSNGTFAKEKVSNGTFAKSNNINRVNNPGASGSGSSSSSQAKSVADTRKEKLQKWKREKEAQEMAAKRTQKQPFKAGVTTAAAAAPVKTTTTTRPATAPTTVPRNNVGGPANAPKVANQNLRNNKPGTMGPSQGVKPKSQEIGGVVTRAMSKATAPSARTDTGMNGRQPAAASTAGMKPAIQKMKNLQISEKPKPTTNSKAGTGSSTNGNLKTGPGTATRLKTNATAPPPSKFQGTTQVSTEIKKIVHTPKPTPTAASLAKSAQRQPPQSQASGKATPRQIQLVESPDASTSESAPVTAIVEKPVEKPKKKMKPRAIDPTYTEFNSCFSNACQRLTNLSSTWTTYIEGEGSATSEKVQGDIRSSLGKVKLLLESKLPQFGELLFSYLCPQADQNPVLACDLQGWWDVASIQLEAVYNIFEDLDKQKNNNWEVPSSPLGSQPPDDVASVAVNDSFEQAKQRVPLKTKPKPAVKAQASGGLKAFLASKRKMLEKAPVPASEEESKTPADVDMHIDNENNDEALKEKLGESLILPNNEKTFDGGFYVISSPKPASLRKFEKSLHEGSFNTSYALPSPLRTPNRRRSQRLSSASSRRVSLCMLGVRQSMGSFSRIGAVAISADERDQNGSTNTLSELKLSEADCEMEI